MTSSTCDVTSAFAYKKRPQNLGPSVDTASKQKRKYFAQCGRPPPPPELPVLPLEALALDPEAAAEPEEAALDGEPPAALDPPRELPPPL
jgi:hypothetical protein